MPTKHTEENTDKLTLLLDSHVHLHQCFEVEQVFSSASKNFAEQAAKMGKSHYLPCLLLTEMQGEDWFADHQELVKKNQGELLLEAGWTLKSTSEASSLWAIHSETNTKLALLAGRQIITKENLEVLALITSFPFPDGLSLPETVDMVITHRGLPVLPWGVGKWFGKRGKLAYEYLQKSSNLKIFIGDNSGRPIGWPKPKIFDFAEKALVPILPGTDALPISSQYSRAGSFGLSLVGKADQNYPAKTIYEVLFSLSSMPERFGTLENPLRFLRNQIFLRL